MQNVFSRFLSVDSLSLMYPADIPFSANALAWSFLNATNRETIITIEVFFLAHASNRKLREAACNIVICRSQLVVTQKRPSNETLQHSPLLTFQHRIPNATSSVVDDSINVSHSMKKKRKSVHIMCLNSRA